MPGGDIIAKQFRGDIIAELPQAIPAPSVCPKPTLSSGVAHRAKPIQPAKVQHAKIYDQRLKALIRK